MASKLKQIYAGIAAWGLIAREQSIPVRGLTNLNTKVNVDNLPVRLLLPVGARADGKNIVGIDLGGVGQTASWKITDLLLLAGSTEGDGLEDFAEPLVDYVVQYVAVVNAHRNKLAGSLIEGLAIATGIYEWPQGSKQWYFGCAAELDIKEIIT